MIQKPFDDIKTQDIEDLVTNQVPEGKTFEYKEALPGNADSDRKECTADITSFANTQGGDLLFGITEERDPTTGKPTGVPRKAQGLAGSNPDQDILRLTTLIRTTTDPRLTNVQTKAITGFPDGPVILFRMPDSWNKPHMVTTNKKFYARTNSGKYEMNTSELRDAFLQTAELPKRIKAFRDERTQAIRHHLIPVALPNRPQFILHLVPYQSMRLGQEIEIKNLDERIQELRPTRNRSDYEPGYNLDGFVVRANPDQDGTHEWYVLVFRNGIIEVVHTAYLSEVQGRRHFNAPSIEQGVIADATRLWQFQQTLGLQLPLVVMLTLTGVNDYRLSKTAPGIDREILALPEALITDPSLEMPKQLRRLIDALWQAAGQRESPSHDAEGNWKPTA
jgi:Putative DNA-binding domain